ncbi:ribonuclease Z, putative [Plasmodium chabaudi chabaudi]|uniref:ribonuclease Z n=1 Tax=Plasmodium chabaudi chabaudi TaxID=31271 RepID=A0A4V0KAK0_PLACU|nr:ribonuclease Z, putative [Plasmodium chabaudi chabaudi]VTZ70285.1 ribonuclease Z, putative [Plasmodium chabaudi chabaudi]|eukprot:XP_016654581.1 tRNA 3'-trailer sequence RNase, putative [Plasmodium chabaudi chabaudi]
MEVYIQMIGWHKLAIPSSLRLFVNGEFTLINCGENNQRFLNEHKMHIARIKNICFTKISPETIGGLIGLLLTIDNISDNAISIYGPKPIERIINNFTSSFAKIKNLKITIHEISDNNIFPIILKGNVIITPILLNKQNVIATNQETDTIQNCEQPVLDKRKKMNEVSNTYDKESNNLYKNKNGEIEEKFSPDEANSNCLKKRKLDIPEMERDETYEGKTEIVNDNNDNVKIEKSNSNTMKSTEIDKNSNMKQCIFYLIECPQTIGKFHVEKAQKLNIPPGKYYGMLKSGKSVTINNKIINPEDVCDKNIDGKKSLIIDLSDTEYIDYVITEIKNKENFYLNNLEYIFHLSDEKILSNKTYKDYFLKLKNIKNIKCNQSNSSLKICPFISSSSLTNILSKLMPNIFLKYKPDDPIYELSSKTLNNYDDEKSSNSSKSANNDSNSIPNGNFKNETECINSDNSFKNEDRIAKIEENTNQNSDQQVINSNESKEEYTTYLSYNTLTKFVLHPFHKINICTDEMLTDLYPSTFNSSKFSNFTQENDNLMKPILDFNKKLNDNATMLPSFHFLGTGCSIPSAFRNVSGIILNIQKDFSVILDFGEGSLYQLYWISKSWIQFTESIKSIKVIFISHAHADHHVGIYYFLYIRKILFPHLNPPLILIPKTLKNWMNLFNELFLDIEMRIIYNENDLEIKEIISEDNFLTLHLFKVNHIKESYGIKLESKDIGSIVYSADTRPCDNVKRFAKDCNILIHEATFDDELLVEAINKKHSTIHEAMQISLDVNCQTLILTHFSQRYPKAPILNKSSSAEINEIMNKTIYSFDYMYIPLNLIKELPTCFNILLNLLEKIF